MTDEQLEAFIRESWKIEGYDEPTGLRTLMRIHRDFLDSSIPTRAALVEAALTFTGNVGVIRDREGLDVQIGYHLPLSGGPGVPTVLEVLLGSVTENQLTPYEAHAAYENLHPFMDGNGRTGRMLWAWHMERTGVDPFWPERGFLHTFYYQSLGAKR